MPHLVLIIDDLSGFHYEKTAELFGPLLKILSAGYKVGIYVIATTSQSKGHALPGEFISLIQSQVVFRLPRKEDYKRFLDTTKLEIPTQKGSFLYKEYHTVHTGQTTLCTMEDMIQLIEYITKQPGFQGAYLLPDTRPSFELERKDFDLNDKDALLEDAAKLVVKHQVGSTSLIQRQMKLGYNRAGRLMDQLEAAGIVGPSEGSKIRDVYIKTEAALEAHLKSLE